MVERTVDPFILLGVSSPPEGEEVDDEDSSTSLNVPQDVALNDVSRFSIAKIYQEEKKNKKCKKRKNKW